MPRKTSYMTVVYSRRIFTVVVKGERLWSLFTINIASNSETFQRVGKKFPSVVEYNNQNLLSIYNAGDHGRYARRIMKILFTLEKMSQSILYANPTYAKPGLNSRRIIIF
ncbi:unnamed protein product [Rotaria magnacalcarata]|uniref:Uncharacterized protein n=1 Tax=Rotaria magnacalcarata TaxID=392030 RepID=A0A815L4Q1_9BILA|nr:unnamed protein product [Rotaria magnacalcarata]